MKKIKFFAVAAFLAVATSASAQFSNSGTKSSSTSGISTDGWSSVWVEWNPSTMKIDRDNVDNESFTGFSLGYSQAFGITAGTPLFLEVGLGIQYSFKTRDMAEELDLDDDDLEYVDPKAKFNLLSAKIPVNLMYAFQIPNSSVTLMPFAGVNLRYNISGKQKMEWNFDDEIIDYMEDEYGRDWREDLGFEEEDINLFDKKDMGGEKNTWKRFQLGWHIGAKARISDKYLIGLSYGTDFSELSKKTKIATTSITLGYIF